MIKVFLFTLLAITSTSSFSKSFYNIHATSLQKKDIALSEFKGKTLLIVNIASQCGYTPQLKGLQNLQKKYQKQNFEVLAFPSNDFKQEPLKGDKIEDFCKFNYGVSFQIFQKSKIIGPEKNSVYQYLTQQTGGTDIQWNFEKFLVSSKGDVYKRYPSSMKPQQRELVQDIETLITQASLK